MTEFYRVFFAYFLQYYEATIAYVKMPFLFMYLRIFGASSKWTRWLLWCTVGVVCFFGVFLLLPIGNYCYAAYAWEDGMGSIKRSGE